MSVSLGIFQDDSMVGSFQALPTPPPNVEILELCTISFEKSTTQPQPTPSPNQFLENMWGDMLIH